MSAVLPKGSLYSPHKATSPARFLMDAETPAVAETVRRSAGRAGPPWTKLGDAAARVIDQAEVAAPDTRSRGRASGRGGGA